MNTPVMAAFGPPRKGLVRDTGPVSEHRHTRGHIHPQGDSPGVADIMRAQALLLGHLYHAKHPITRAQHRAIVQDMIDWAQAMDAKEKLIVALAEGAQAEPRSERKPHRGPENPAVERRAAA